MSRKLRVILVALMALFVGALAAFGQNSNRPASRSVVLTGDAMRSLFSQCSRPSPEGIDNYWTPTVRDLRALDSTFPKFIQAQKLPEGVTAKSLNLYYFQCAGFIRKGRKMIYVNAFSPNHTLAFALEMVITPDMKATKESVAKARKRPHWHQKAETVCDGGSSFWGVEYDPETRQFTHLYFNGRA